LQQACSVPIYEMAMLLYEEIGCINIDAIINCSKSPKNAKTVFQICQ